MARIKELSNYPFGEYQTTHSEYLEADIPTGFVLKYSASDYVIVGKEHFTWNEEDLVYYSDDVDGKMYWIDDIVQPYMNYWHGFRVDFILDM